MSGAHILVVDDDDRLRELLRRYLSDQGYAVTVAGNAEEARAHIRSVLFDLMVLDVMMPGETGVTLTQRLRDEANDVPVLLLTALGEPEDRIEGLQAGADDYLPKPFEPRELVLRIETILRRVRAARPVLALLKLGAFDYDVERQRLSQGDAPVYLTSGEQALLTALSRAVGRAVSRDELIESSHATVSERTVDVQIARLRRKIEPDPARPTYIQTVRGIGYQLYPDATP